MFQAKKKSYKVERTGKWSTFKINFITLTLPSKQVHDDKTIKSQIFEKWLTEMRNMGLIKEYVWRAELQANGNIHFHLATDTYLHWEILRNSWNRKCEKLGYVTRYQNQWKNVSYETYRQYRQLTDKAPETQIRKAYEKNCKENWSNPNSTDVHATKNVRNLGAYLSKYMAKESNSEATEDHTQWKNRIIEGRNWGCSYLISRVRKLKVIRDSTLEHALSMLVKVEGFAFQRFDYCTQIYIDLANAKTFWGKALKKYLLDHLATFQLVSAPG